jgi:hypothetical protein
MSNSFKPYFIGRFEVRDGVTVLTGRFTMALFAKIFMSVWFGMMLLFAGATLLASISSPTLLHSFWMLQPFLMLGFGIALVAVGKWLSRNDTAWLSHVIEGALGGAKNSGAATMPPANADPDAVPTTLKVVAIVVAVSGALQLLGHFLPFHLANGNAGLGNAIPSRPFGDWDGVIGTGLLILAVGIWRRQPWAWWAGFFVLGASWVGFVVAMHRQVGVGPPIAIQLIFGALALAITVIWGLWWYAQRKHFLWE